jgi:hypothetical protein
LRTVQKAKSDGYHNLKTSLGMDNKTLLNFIKSKLIKSYEGKDIALNIQTPEVDQK